MSEMNVVPFIDVMLVLLIIFMVATPLMNKGLDVEVARLTTEQAESLDTLSDAIYVEMDAEGNYATYIQGGPRESLDLAAMRNRLAMLRDENPEAKVLLRVDKNLTQDQILDLVSVLDEMGINEGIQFIVNPEE